MSKLTDAGAHCTARYEVGRFCDRPSLPGAPFPICMRHASLLLRFINDSIPDGASALTIVRDMEDELRPIATRVEDLPADGVGVVYYMRIGRYIKIGHTVDLQRRFRFYPPDTEVLAYEYGDRTLERHRLNQFLADRRRRNEWHKPSDELMAHIRRLQAAMDAAA